MNITIPEDFDPNLYKYLNPDLQNMNEDELKKHYISYGFNEAREYKLDLPDDFHHETYRLLNHDLTFYDEINLKLHYSNIGKNEKNRIYKLDDFDWIKYIETYYDLNSYINNYNDALNHWIKYGETEGRTYFKINNYEMNILSNKNLFNFEMETSKLEESNIIFSLNMNTDSFIGNLYIEIIENLNNQKIIPKYIIFNIFFNFDLNDERNILIKNKINGLKNNYHNVIFNLSHNYGKMTQLFGLLNLNDILNKNDKIIFMNNDVKINNYTTYYYDLVYNLYNCYGVFIDENNIINIDKESNDIFYDNYQSFVSSDLTYSLKYKFIFEIYKFYLNITTINEKLKDYNDFMITLFYKINKLYVCGINLFFNLLENETVNQFILKKFSKSKDDYYFEKSILKLFKIDFSIIKKKIYLNNILNKYDFDLNIDSLIINPRKILYNIENIKFNNQNNHYITEQIDIKYFRKNIFILTITNFTDSFFEKKIINLDLNINNKNKSLNINIENQNSRKQTFFINLNIPLIKINHTIFNFNLFQINLDDKISLNKFYSINTILNYIPDIKYILFNKFSILKFLKKNNIVFYNIYNILRPKQFKIDYFKIIYLYLKSGLYIDSNLILYQNIYNYLNKSEFYTKDYDDKIFSGLLYCNYTLNNNLKNYLSEINFIIFTFFKGSNFKDIIEPTILKKYIIGNYLFYNCYDDESKNECLKDLKTNNIIFKNSYIEYNDNIKDISKYIINEHCYTLYNENRIYNKICIDYDKINGISLIVYINSSTHRNRNDYMINLLKSLKIYYKRIEFINESDSITELINIPYERPMNNDMIYHTLSHIKAINYLNNFKNSLDDYYMICEDDISFENLILSKNDLKSIIENSPEFDILMIHKYCNITCENLYEDWNEYFDKGVHFSGTSCYIISKNGVKNFMKYAKYVNDLNFVLNSNKNFDVSDIYIYKNLKTYIYKYNFVGILDAKLSKKEYSKLHDTLNTIQIEEITKNII